MSAEAAEVAEVAEAVVGAEIVHLHLTKDPDFVPDYLQKRVKREPLASSVMAIDDLLPMVPLIQLLTANGYSVVGTKSGRIVVTQRPQEFSVS